MKPDGLDSATTGAGALKEAPWAILFFACLTIVFFYDISFMGKTLRASNTTSTTLGSGHYNYPGGRLEYIPVYDNTPALLEEPYQEFKEAALKEGIIPLWNPHQAGGYPFLATFESSLLFLPEVVLYILPSPYRWDAYLFFRLFLAGIFTYAFVRVLELGRLPSAVAGVTYMFSGPLLVFVTNVTLNADIMLPLLLLSLELILRRESKRYVALCALAVFQTVAGGHPEHCFITFLTGAIYVIFRLWTRSYAYRFSRVIRHLLIALIAGTGMSTLLLFPFGEYLFFNSWNSHWEGTGQQALPLKEAISILFPKYFSDELVSYGLFIHHTWPGGWLGFLPLMLASLAFCARGRRRFGLIFIGVALVYLSKDFGLPLVNWIGRIPIFDLVKYQLHNTQAIAFAVAVLCGLSVSYMLADRRNVDRFILLAVPFVLVSVAIYFAHPPANHPWRAFGVPGVILSIVLAGYLLLSKRIIGRRVFAAGVSVLVLAELFLMVPRERALRAKAFQVPPYVEFLRRDPTLFRVFGVDVCLLPNTATGFGLDDIGMYEGLFVDRFATYIHELVDKRFFHEYSFHAFRASVKDPGNRFLDLLNLKYFILPRGAVIPAESMKQLSLKQVYEREVLILERENALPRAMIRHRADFVPEDHRVLEMLKKGYDFKRGVILSGPAGHDPGPVIRAGEGVSDVEVTGYKPGFKSFAVRMPGRGYLVVNDVHYPGWEVRIDGEMAEILRANYLFQAVKLAAGDHKVVFRFRPGSVYAGLVVALLSLLALLVWMAVPAKRG